MSMKAVVKSVLSGDTLVLRGRPGPNGESAKERLLYLADITAPRMGTQSREDEPWAFESREFLRTNLVGKEISFTVTVNLPAGTEDGTSQRDIGTAELAGRDVAGEVLRNGWAKVKELKREPTEEDQRRRDLEAEAKAAGKGMWNPHGPQAREVHYTMPVDSTAFINEWKGKEIDSVVETVRDGSTLRVRLLLPDNRGHHVVNLALAGVRCARASTRPGETAEPWGEEAKTFTELRLLQRSVKVVLLSLPSSTGPTPFQPNGGAAPQPTTASIFIGSVIHPAGNVAEHLVANGLARVVDWHAGMLSSTPGAMERLRAAERTAKEKRLALYASAPITTGKPSEGGSAPTPQGARSFEGTVIRVWSGDQISVVDKEGKERRIQLSSVRGPKMSDPKQAFYANEAREFLRKRLIGKNVRVHIDFIRPAEGEFEEREAATVRYGGSNANVAEQLIEKGLAGVVRHRRDDENRSPDYDKFIVAEQAAQTEGRGMHSGKEQPAPKAPVNVSETFNRASQSLNSFKRLGKIPAVVEYVASGSRFKIFIPKDNQVLTLVLAGIKAPRTARNASEKSEPMGPEASAFATQKYMQRDVEIEIETVDKSGGFIGALYLNKTENAAITLAREGLASVHAYSAEGLSWARQLFDAETEAKKAKRGLWKDYDEEAEKAAETATATEDNTPLENNYIDVIVSDVRPGNDLTFSIQILNTEGIASLEQLMQEFSIHHKSASSPAGFNPRPGELVSAKFSDGQWYRAKIKRASVIKKEAEVVFIDYGNHSTLGFKDLRPLDPKFRSLKGQAQDARLSFVKLVSPDSEYHTEAIDRFRSLCEGRKLIANIDHRDATHLHLRLIDPSDPNASNDKLASINAELVREGLAMVDRKGCRYLSSYPQIDKYLKQAVNDAKKDRAGMFEFGDVEEDD